MTQHETTILQARPSEVQEESTDQSARLQIVEHLRDFRSSDHAQRLKLYNYLIITNEVHPVMRRKATALEGDAERHFAGKGDPSTGQRKGHGLPVSGFQEARPQLAVDLHGRTDDGVGFGIARRRGGRHPDILVEPRPPPGIIPA